MANPYNKLWTMDEQARKYATSYINGNRESTCLEILAGPNPAVMASIVTRTLARLGGFDEADAFIRILEAQTE